MVLAQSSGEKCKARIITSVDLDPLIPQSVTSTAHESMCALVLSNLFPLLFHHACTVREKRASPPLLPLACFACLAGDLLFLVLRLLQLVLLVEADPLKLCTVDHCSKLPATVITITVGILCVPKAAIPKFFKKVIPSGPSVLRAIPLTNICSLQRYDAILLNGTRCSIHTRLRAC